MRPSGSWLKDIDRTINYYMWYKHSKLLKIVEQKTVHLV